ncbi:MAG: hypothetical protein NVS3B12_12970 [Acidimicrobiales bacterium]
MPTDTAQAAPSIPRVVSRRRRLPGSRPVVGALVIAASAVTCFAGYTGAHRAPHQLYVIAARPLRPGMRITAADLALAPLNVPAGGVRRSMFGSIDGLVGASVVAPVDSGSLIEASQVVGRGGAPGTREISVTIDRSRAVGGTLKAGEFVDILATFGTGADSYTVVVVPHVRVLTVSSASGPLADTRTQTIVLAASDGTAAEAIADASIAAQVTIVRAAEQVDGTPTAPTPAYRPPPASAPSVSAR